MCGDAAQRIFGGSFPGGRFSGGYAGGTRYRRYSYSARDTCDTGGDTDAAGAVFGQSAYYGR